MYVGAPAPAARAAPARSAKGANGTPSVHAHAAHARNGAAEVAVHDVDVARSERIVGLLKEKWGNKVRVGEADPTGFDVVSNATPMGMEDGDPLPLDTTRLSAEMFVGDVVAGHGETAWIKAAKEAGCKTADGDAMVVAVLDVMCDFLQDAWVAQG